MPTTSITKFMTKPTFMNSPVWTNPRFTHITRNAFFPRMSKFIFNFRNTNPTHRICGGFAYQKSTTWFHTTCTLTTCTLTNFNSTWLPSHSGSRVRRINTNSGGSYQELSALFNVRQTRPLESRVARSAQQVPIVNASVDQLACVIIEIPISQKIRQGLQKFLQVLGQVYDRGLVGTFGIFSLSIDTKSFPGRFFFFGAFSAF